MRPDNEKLRAVRALLCDAVMDLEPPWSNDRLEDVSDDDVKHALAKVQSACEQLVAAVADIDRKGRPSTTIFECKCCGSCITCRNDDDDVEFRSNSWKRLRGVDGPNAICPLCQVDIRAFDALKEDGYEDVCVY